MAMVYEKVLTCWTKWRHCTHDYIAQYKVSFPLKISGSPSDTCRLIWKQIGQVQDFTGARKIFQIRCAAFNLLHGYQYHCTHWCSMGWGGGLKPLHFYFWGGLAPSTILIILAIVQYTAKRLMQMIYNHMTHPTIHSDSASSITSLHGVY